MSISAGDFLINSYKRPINQHTLINNYERDNALSGRRAQVYHNPMSGDTVVVHRGTGSVKDIFNDLTLVNTDLFKKTKRFKHAQKIQNQAKQKYGAENVTTLGHSLGGIVSEQLNDGTGKVATFNKASVGGVKTKPNQTDYRTTTDVVSVLSAKDKGKGKKKTLLNLNPFKAHGVDQFKNVKI